MLLFFYPFNSTAWHSFTEMDRNDYDDVEGAEDGKEMREEKTESRKKKTENRNNNNNIGSIVVGETIPMRFDIVLK